MTSKFVKRSIGAFFIAIALAAPVAATPIANVGLGSGLSEGEAYKKEITDSSAVFYSISGAAGDGTSASVSVQPGGSSEAAYVDSVVSCFGCIGNVQAVSTLWQVIDITYDKSQLLANAGLEDFETIPLEIDFAYSASARTNQFSTLFLNDGPGLIPVSDGSGYVTNSAEVIGGAIVYQRELNEGEKPTPLYNEYFGENFSSFTDETFEFDYVGATERYSMTGFSHDVEDAFTEEFEYSPGSTLMMYKYAAANVFSNQFGLVASADIYFDPVIKISEDWQYADQASLFTITYANANFAAASIGSNPAPVPLPASGLLILGGLAGLGALRDRSKAARENTAPVAEVSGCQM